MQVFGISDVGMQRSLNEDNFSVNIIGDTVVALVCDGMGGANAGEVASRTACKLFTGSIVSKLREIKSGIADKSEQIIKIDRAIYEACDIANKEIYQSSVKNYKLSGMGTTISGCIIDGDLMWTFNVGDSRVYHITDDKAKQLTVDHSFVQALLDDGKITTEEAKNHPNRNVILRALGIGGKVDCDVSHLTVENGYYLVCSDGMSNYFNEEDFIRIVSTGKPLSEKAEDFIELANFKGGADNITVILIDTEKRGNGGRDEH